MWKSRVPLLRVLEGGFYLLDSDSPDRPYQSFLLTAMTEKFISIECMGIPTESHGMLVNVILIGEESFYIGKLPYLEAYPHVSVPIGNMHLLKSYPERPWDKEKERLEKSLAELILRIEVEAVVGIIGTSADLDILTELCEDFDIGDLRQRNLHRFLVHPDLAIRLEPLLKQE